MTESLSASLRKDWAEEWNQFGWPVWDVWFSPTSQSVAGSPLPCSSMSMTTAPPSASSDRLDLALLERSEPEISNLAIPSYLSLAIKVWFYDRRALCHIVRRLSCRLITWAHH